MPNRTALPPAALLWLRRDFRLHDQTALLEATRTCEHVVPVFVIDPRTLKEFGPGLKPHAAFFGALLALRSELRSHGKDIWLIEGDPVREIPALCHELRATHLFFNKDYEPQGITRDRAVTKGCEETGVVVRTFKDQSLFEESEVLNQSGSP